MFADRPSLAARPAGELALDCLTAGIRAAQPGRAVRRTCAIEDGRLRVRGATYDLEAYDEVVVLGGGKGADEVAAALGDLLAGGAGGLVVTDSRTADSDGVTVRLGEHPMPGEGSVAGADAVLERARAADAGTLVLAAITGGGSALLCAPADDLTAADVGTATDGLLLAGAPVDEVNLVRRTCSAIKGGGLAAAAAPATVVGLVLSDVVGDDPAVVASGPTVPQRVDPDAALAVLDRYDVDAPSVREFLDRSSPSPAPDVPVDTHVVASPEDAVAAAAGVASERGYEPCVLSTRIEGEASEAGRFHAAIATSVADASAPVEPPAVLLSGGETTVTVEGNGVGGPNLEFVVAGGIDVPPPAVLAAVDTDGRDGGTDAAGALVDGIDDADAGRRALADNDAYPFLADREALLRTGPTGTNVNDLRIAVVEAKRFWPPGTDFTA